MAAKGPGEARFQEFAMRKMLGLAIGVIISLGSVYLVDEALAQRPGSTVQGDILRGQGRFLEGGLV